MMIHDNGKAPYTAPSAVISIIERFRDRGLQTPFTNEVLAKAGVSEGLAPRTLQALKLLDFINDDGEPTEQFIALQRAPTDEFKDRLAEMLRAAYAPVFAFVDPAEDPAERVKDAFRGFSPPSQRRRMITLFLNLCEYAGIVKEKPKVPPGPKPKSAPKKTATKDRRSRRAGADTSITGGTESLPPALSGLVRQSLPQTGKWTRDERDAFVQAFTMLLDYSYQVVQESTEGENERDEPE